MGRRSTAGKAVLQLRAGRTKGNREKIQRGRIILESDEIKAARGR